MANAENLSEEARRVIEMVQRVALANGGILTDRDTREVIRRQPPRPRQPSAQQRGEEPSGQ